MADDQKQKLRSRKPRYDLRNIGTRLSSRSSPSSSSHLKKTFRKSIKFSAAKTPPNNVRIASNSIDLNFPPPTPYSSPSTPVPSSSSWVSGIGDELWEHSPVYSRRKTLDKSKSKRKVVLEPIIMMSMTGGKHEEIEGNKLGRPSKASPKKKQRHMPSEQAFPQDFIDQQRAYFNEIDLEPLSVEEIESDAELEC